MAQESQSQQKVSQPSRKAGLHKGAPAGRADCELEVERVDGDGVALKAFDAQAFGRYVWMDLDVGDGQPLRALGEVMQRRDPAAVALDIRFKHLFPDYRRRLLEALERP